MWVLWNEDGALHLPGEAGEQVATYALAVGEGSTSVRVTTAVTEVGAEPGSESRPVEDGEVVLELGAAPVFVVGE